MAPFFVFGSSYHLTLTLILRLVVTLTLILTLVVTLTLTLNKHPPSLYRFLAAPIVRFWYLDSFIRPQAVKLGVIVVISFLRLLKRVPTGPPA